MCGETNTSHLLQLARQMRHLLCCVTKCVCDVVVWFPPSPALQSSGCCASPFARHPRLRGTRRSASAVSATHEELRHTESETARHPGVHNISTRHGHVVIQLRHTYIDTRTCMQTCFRWRDMAMSMTDCSSCTSLRRSSLSACRSATHSALSLSVVACAACRAQRQFICIEGGDENISSD
jgi:hypothetical protein